jgi:ribonuclease J
MVKIHTVGGFSEVGNNMVVVEVGEDAFIFDEGFFLPAIVSMQERDHVMTEKKLQNIGAIPDISVVEKIKDKVRAQFISHAHLDHVGAIPFISDRYNAPIYGTPFSVQVLNSLLRDNDIVLKNKVLTVRPNTTFYVKGKAKKYKVDFIHMTHSTVQCSMIALHTPEGVVIFSGDFKLDDTPVIGPKPNYKKLKELGDKGVIALIVNSLYSGTKSKTPSESFARDLLKKTLDGIENKREGMIVTTFASHIARLKSIVEFGQKMGREVVFLGRSLDKYSMAAKNAGLAPFLSTIKISKYRRQVEKSLHNVERKRKDHMIVCTGHQGEPGSILDRLSRHQLPFKITKDDNIVFSSSVIPTPVNKEQFSKMEARLKKSKPRIFRDVHVSGHGREEDLKQTIEMIRPKHIIPWHGDWEKTKPMVELVKEFGYKLDKTCHLMNNGEVLNV